MSTKARNRDTFRVAADGERDVLITRRFDAPRRLVYDAHTKPELLRRWLCPFGWQLVVCEVDLRVGGEYRYLWRNERDGATMGAGGVYREIVEPEKISATERFDDAWYPGEAVVTHTFEDKGAWTLLNLRIRYQSETARDGVIRSPMAGGVSAGYDQLEELLGPGVSAP